MYFQGDNKILYLQRTCNDNASLTLRCNASFLLSHVYSTPFMSWVTFNFSSNDDTVPPHRPGFESTLIPSTGIRALCQLIFAAGLLELDSQINVASTPGTNSSGCTRIFTVSGATI